MPHMSGGKISKSHTTVISAAAPVVTRLQKDPRVSKITLGKIDNKAGSGSSGTKRIKIIDEEHCVVIAVSGNSANQDLWVYLDDNENRRGFKAVLSDFLSDNDYKVTHLDRRK